MLSTLNRTSIWQRLLIGLLFVAAASAFRAVFFSSLGRGIPYLVFYPAVMLAALYGGQLAGFVATLLTTSLCYFWVQQGYLSRLEELALVIFFISCIIVSMVCESLRRSQIQAKLSTARAEALNQELRSEVANREQLMMTYAHLASIVESSEAAIIGKDLAGNVSSWNAAAERIFGYAASEMVGASINRLIPLDRLDDEQAIVRQIQHGERVAPFETVRLTKDGQLLEVSVTESPIRDAAAKVVGTSKVAHDITARKRAEETMRRMATVVKDSNDAITIQDFGGRITAWNHGAELMYGYSEAEALTENIERLTAPGKVAEQKDFICRLIAGEAITSFETQRVTKDGRVLDVWMTVTKLIDEAGKPVGLASTERDITERKRVEEALREHDAELRLRNETLSRFNGVAVGRELRMIELKREVNELCEKLGEPPRHKIARTETIPAAEPETLA